MTTVSDARIEQIATILGSITVIWREHPELLLMQLLLHAIGVYESKDADMLLKLEELYKEQLTDE